MILTETVRLADDERIRRVMRQSWERWQEAEREKVEREAPALAALGFPPEEFFPVEWPGPVGHTFADMVREWEAPLMAHTKRKRDQLAEAFDGLFTLAEGVA